MALPLSLVIVILVRLCNPCHRYNDAWGSIPSPGF
jgi:hypothetical protein